MAVLNSYVQASSSEGDGFLSFGPVPKGKYLAVIQQSKPDDINMVHGSMVSLRVNLKFTLLNPPYDGRIVWMSLILHQADAQDKRLAYIARCKAQLNTMAIAAGLGPVKAGFDTDSLFGREVVVALDIQPESTDANGKTWPPKNVVTGVFPPTDMDKRSASADIAAKASANTNAPLSFGVKPRDFTPPPSHNVDFDEDIPF